MSGFADEIVQTIISTEIPKIQNIIQEVAKNIQKDVVNKTYSVIDKFYQDYSPEVYIRIDDYKAKPSKRRDKKGNRLVRKRDRNISLKSAVTKGMDSDQPAIGICEPLAEGLGWQAGVIFDEGYFQRNMRHSYKGKNFTEWDIVEDFLWGVHGNESVATTDPSAGWELYEFINTYQSTFDKHYKDACKKFR